MYSKILVPLDGSERAEAILAHVENLASCYQAAVIFMQVIEPSMVYASPYDAYPELSLDEADRRSKEVEDYLAGLAADFQAKGIQARWLAEYGPVVLTILEVAARENVDLIAMASHGRSGLARVFYGSVAAGILHRIDRPLLLIRAQ